MFLIDRRPVNSTVMRFLLAVSMIVLMSVASYAQKHAPLPEKLISARKVYLINESGDVKVFDKLFQELQKWGRFAIVTSRADADVIAILSDRSSGSVTLGNGTIVGSGGAATGSGTYVTVPNEYMYIRIVDAENGDALWSHYRFPAHW